MTVSVPDARWDLSQSEVLIGESVRSLTWVYAAWLHNWIAGRGGVVVPCFRPDVETQPANDTIQYTLRWKARYQDVRYILRLTFVSSTESVPLTVVVEGSDTYVVVAHPRTAPPEEHEFIIDRGVQNTNEVEVDFTVQDVGEIDDWSIEACSVVAVPRSVIADDANELGLNRTEFMRHAPIEETNLGAIAARQAALIAAGRRVGCFTHAFGDFQPWETSSGTLTPVFGEYIALQGRYLYDGDTVRELSVRVLAYCSDGSTSGEVVFTADNGDTVTISIPTSTTAATWLPSTGGDPAALDVNAEDNTSATGLRGGARDNIAIEARRTAGAGTVYIETISIWEA